jgi:protein subunit release factor B
VDVLDEAYSTDGDFPKHMTLFVEGDSYGWLKSEAGIHRFIRSSPFTRSSKIHTSFVGIQVYPTYEEKKTTSISSSDLKIETFRSSGPGGQHVNRTDSAVRITHIPTSISVSVLLIFESKSRYNPLDHRVRTRKSHCKLYKVNWKLFKSLKNTRSDMSNI